MAKNEDRVELKKGRSQWNIVGRAKVNDYTYKIDQTSTKSDWVFHVLNLGVDTGNGNVVYVDMMGGYGAERENVLYVHGKKHDDKLKKDVDDYDNRYTIAWEDRFNEDIIGELGEGCFIKVGLEKDVKGNTVGMKFLSDYDAIAYIKEHLEEGMIVNVKGGWQYQLYNDTVSKKKIVKSIFLSKSEEKDFRATFTQSILIDEDSVGKFDKEKNTFPIYTRVLDYTKMYNGKEVKQTIPMSIIYEFEARETVEQTKKALDYIFKVKKGITEMIVEGDIIEGATTVQITEDDLSDELKALMAAGVFNKEQAVGKSAVKTDREKRLIIKNPSMKKVYDNEGNVINVIMERTEEKYKVEDLIFDFMLDDSEDVPFEVSKEIKKTEVDDAELEDESTEEDFANILANL
jgi:hypothetical protein